MNHLHLSYSRSPINGKYYVRLYINNKFIVDIYEYLYHNTVAYADSSIDPLLFDSYPFLDMYYIYKQFRKSMYCLGSDV